MERTFSHSKSFHSVRLTFGSELSELVVQKSFKFCQVPDKTYGTPFRTAITVYLRDWVCLRQKQMRNLRVVVILLVFQLMMASWLYLYFRHPSNHERIRSTVIMNGTDSTTHSNQHKSNKEVRKERSAEFLFDDAIRQTWNVGSEYKQLPSKFSSELESLPDTECILLTQMQQALGNSKPFRNGTGAVSHEYVDWIGFLPKEIPLVEDSSASETELRAYFKINIAEFFLNNHQDVMSESLDVWKREKNAQHFVLNAEKFDKSSIDRGEHLPIWLRAHQRRLTLREVMTHVCSMHGLEKTILYVTIDGNLFFPLLEELMSFTCVKIRIYFHPIRHNLGTFNMKNPPRNTLMTLHAVFGLYLLFHKLKYPYVIFLEDDIAPLPDFYNYHLSLFTKTIEPSSKYIAIASHAHGTAHHCNYMASSLYHEGLLQIKPNPLTNLCQLSHLDHLVRESYLPIWGVGIPKRLFHRVWNAWRQGEFFLGPLLNMLMREDEVVLTPCSNRIGRIKNEGVNGGGKGLRFWEASYESCKRYQTNAYKWPALKRQYVVL